MGDENQAAFMVLKEIIKDKDKRIRELAAALDSCLIEASAYYSLYPNAHRATYEEYYADEIKALNG